MSSAIVVAVNTDIDSIREAIPSTLCELNDWFVSHGWEFSITNSSHIYEDCSRFEVTVKRNHWLGELAHTYEWTYLSADNSEIEMLKSCRKLAELCARLEESFIADKYPNPFAYDDGFIYEDVQLKELADASSEKRYQYLSSVSRERFNPPEKTISIRSGFLIFAWRRSQYLCSMAELITLEECLLENTSK